MLNYATILEETARRRPNKTAFVLGEERLSYAALDAAANQVANGLVARGIKPGDKIAMSCPSLLAFPIVYFGVLKAGAVFVPLNILLKADEIAYHLKDCEAKAFFCFEGIPGLLPMGDWGREAAAAVDTLEQFYLVPLDPAAGSSVKGELTLADLTKDQPSTFEYVDTSADDTSIIIYTSGTTGNPKGAELTHSAVLLNTLQARDLADYGPDEVALIVLPLFHVFGLLVQVGPGVYNGGTMVLQPRFDPEETLQLMAKEKVSVFCGVPTMYWALLHHKSETVKPAAAAKHLRVCLSSGSAMPGEILTAFEKKFKTTIVEGYGMSEASPGITFSRLDEPRKIGSVGTPLWGVKVKLVDEDGEEAAQGERGEIVFRGHNMMKGYYNAPEKTAKTIINGWLHTGDVGVFDEDGYLYIVDRIKEMILRGGENIYPTEIEQMMLEHEAISLVAVIGTPNEKYGEEIKACVVLKDGASATPKEIIAWSRERMAGQKYPREVEIMSALPMTATGKILKKELKEMELKRAAAASKAPKAAKTAKVGKAPKKASKAKASAK